jgi:NAD(P)-dependent dehydrogenase (short-subunit alcohol dehydrogenase family)
VSGALNGKVALVTGAASGIGRATAELFAAEGASVVVADLDEAGSDTVSAIEAAGGTATFVSCDVSNENSVADLLRSTVAAYGRLDCAVNNAAILADGGQDIDEEDVELFDRQLRVNLRSAFLCIKHEARQMKAQGDGGSIVNTGSTASLRPVVSAPGYTAVKHAIIGLSKVASAQLAPHQIRVNVVGPGATLTPMQEANLRERGIGEADLAEQYTKLGRLAQPSEIAQASLWLCSDVSAYVTGHTLMVDGGYTSL